MKKIIILITSIILIFVSCKKGSKGDRGPTGANGSSVGYMHYLGETYRGGVIFHLFKESDGSEHGLIASFTQTNTVKWQSIETYVTATRTWDGAYNTNLMINSPAADYVHSLGSDWYVPSIDEITKLYQNRFEVNKALNDGGHTLILMTDSYWSSTEFGGGQAFAFTFIDGKTSNQYKSALLIVRGVKSF